jgi:hypothetical protein
MESIEILFPVRTVVMKDTKKNQVFYFFNFSRDFS